MNILLILDESSVAAHECVTFKWNQAVKHAENPVLLPGESHQWDSLQVSWPATVLYSEVDRKFRCWYAGLDAIQTPGRRWHNDAARSSLPRVSAWQHFSAIVTHMRPEVAL